MSNFQLTILGSGTSTGIPVVGCDCSTCTSDDPRDKRTRTSALIQIADKNILIDTGIDLRQQLLTNKVSTVDNVLYTHYHSDHILGIEELRPISWRRNEPIPIYGSKETLDELTKTFGYIFFPSQDYSFVPKLTPNQISYHQSFEVEGLEIISFPLNHGKVTVTGYKIGSLVYATDVKAIPPESEKYFINAKTIILDALRLTESPNHFTLDEALATLNRFHCADAYLIHMSHGIKADIELPPNVQLTYDGLKLQFKA